MRYLIIGAVAGGTSAAAEIRRQDPAAEIVVYEKGQAISYAGCGMPFYISSQVRELRQIAPRDTAYFMDKSNIQILTGHEVQAIHPAENALTVLDLAGNRVFRDHYDALIIATGASVRRPDLKGADGPRVYPLRTLDDALALKAAVTEQPPKTAAIIGTGFVGLEMCESLTHLGISTALIARSSVAKTMDPDMAELIEAHLREKGVSVHKSAPAEITPTHVRLADGTEVPAELVLLATGVRPNVDLARAAGIEIGPTGAIRVDKHMKTNFPNIYSCGDCAEQYHVLTGKPIYRPLGSTANKTGVIAGNNAAGGSDTFKGVLGTTIFRVFDLSVAQTGLSHAEATEAGFDSAVSIDTKPDKPHYMGGAPMTIKAVADKATGRLLGAQIVGHEGVDKRMDVLVTAITLGGTARDLIDLDLAYAPPFSTARDPLYYTGAKLQAKTHAAKK